MTLKARELPQYATQTTTSLAHQFREFAIKGNVIDLAIGVIIGAAFGKIVDSLVKDIIMPLVSVVAPSQDTYNNWKLVLNGKEILYGHFIAEVVNFFLVALVLFVVVVKFLGWIRNFNKKEEGKPTPLTKDQELLTEIRDLLKSEHAPAQSS